MRRSCSPVSSPLCIPARPLPVYADNGSAKLHAVRMVWPIVARRLEALPNISATQLFEEISIEFPGRFTRAQYKTLLRRVNRWREDAKARGVVIGPKTYRLTSNKPRDRRPQIFEEHWSEMTTWIETHPDQTALGLLIEFQARYPGRYTLRQLYTLQRYVRKWGNKKSNV